MCNTPSHRDSTQMRTTLKDSWFLPRVRYKEDAEHHEVGLVGREERSDAYLPVSGGKERVQQSLAAQRELLQPGEKLPGRSVIGEHAYDFTRRPSLLGNMPDHGHVKRLCEATGVSNDMDELCQNLWGNRDEVTRRQQPGKRVPCASVLGMLRHLCRDQKAGVE